MGYRLSKIYTRRGDGGSTSIADGTKLTKSALRIEALGSIDELNCVLGVMLAHQNLAPSISECLLRLQNSLFCVGSELALPRNSVIVAADVYKLEIHLEELNASLKPLEEFILPGGVPAAATCHLARSVCRRAERVLVKLDRKEKLNSHLLAYINRLSDLLFVIARSINHKAGRQEIMWDGGSQ